MFAEVTQAEYIGDYKVRVHFSDGAWKIADFYNILFSNEYPAFVPLKNVVLFKEFTVTDTLEWDEGKIAIAPEKIYEIGELEEVEVEYGQGQL